MDGSQASKPGVAGSPRHVHHGGLGYVGLEFRLEHNGQVFRTEVHKERGAFYRRVEE